MRISGLFTSRQNAMSCRKRFLLCVQSSNFSICKSHCPFATWYGHCSCKQYEFLHHYPAQRDAFYAFPDVRGSENAIVELVDAFIVTWIHERIQASSVPCTRQTSHRPRQCWCDSSGGWVGQEGLFDPIWSPTPAYAPRQLCNW